MKVEEIKAKAGELKTKLAEIKKFWDDTADTDLKDFTNEQKQAIDKLNKEAQQLNDEIEESKGYAAELAKQEVMRSMLSQPVGRPEFANTDPRTIQRAVKSAGRQFVEDPAIIDWLEKGLGLKGPGASLPDRIKIDSPAVECKTIIMSGSNSGGAFVRREYDTPVDLPLRPLSILDLITRGRTGSNLVEYVRTTLKTRAAAVVPEVSDVSGSGYTTGAKPQSSMAFEIVQEGVKTIAVWMPITRQILSDAPQLESEIDNFEEQDLLLELEEQIITGTGGTNFRGLENTPGITPHARVAADTDLLVTTRKARTTSRIVARANSTGYLFNPYDWQDIDLLRNATAGNFYFGGPMVMGTQQLWGLPVAESEVIPQGTGYTGNLKEMKLWDREQPTRRITDSHSDFFTHNLIAILTELRAAFGVRRPAGIVKIDLLVGPNS
jgi:HK97 family phage major capsid protein